MDSEVVFERPIFYIGIVKMDSDLRVVERRILNKLEVFHDFYAKSIKKQKFKNEEFERVHFR